MLDCSIHKQLFPLVVGFSIYSLFYRDHKGWSVCVLPSRVKCVLRLPRRYSWILGSLVGATYTFGFLLMVRCPALEDSTAGHGGFLLSCCLGRPHSFSSTISSRVLRTCHGEHSFTRLSIRSCELVFVLSVSVLALTFAFAAALFASCER